MSTITFDALRKIYPDGTEAIPAFDLEVADGEFVALVGPSGCGKSTILRMTAGLEDISAGTLRIGDRTVNDVSPQDRDIAMVFQDYALYPHMTVRQNMAFPLKMAKVSKAEQQRRVEQAAERMSLTALLDRKPGRLSGGQRQRVAMGRAIVREPAAFLMDEPLSNLDAKLRVQMRAEIAGLQRQLGVTTLYVTHDQVEAMTMGDRVAVMRSGRLQQCATPQELYDRPSNVFVAGFIGSPKMNLFASTLTWVDGGGAQLEFAGQTLDLPADEVARRPALAGRAAGPITVGLRPEAFSHDPDHGQLKVVAQVVEALGPETLLHFPLDVEAGFDGDVRDRAQADDHDPVEADASVVAGGGMLMCARLVPPLRVPVGTGLRLSVDTSAVYLFEPDGTAILRADA